MTKDERPPSIEDLAGRIRKARNARSEANSAPPQTSPIGLALRMAVEMVSSLFVGTAMGWLLDRWLDTGPWFLLVCLLLGGASGMLNVYKTGRRLHAPVEEGQERPEGKKDPKA